MQWQMDGSGLGRLTPSEYGVLYLCCMAFVKTLPLASIGWKKVRGSLLVSCVMTQTHAAGVHQCKYQSLCLCVHNHDKGR
jgi:hypothetical protein